MKNFFVLTSEVSLVIIGYIALYCAIFFDPLTLESTIYSIIDVFFMLLIQGAYFTLIRHFSEKNNWSSQVTWVLLVLGILFISPFSVGFFVYGNNLDLIFVLPHFALYTFYALAILRKVELPKSPWTIFLPAILALLLTLSQWFFHIYYTIADTLTPSGGPSPRVELVFEGEKPEEIIMVFSVPSGEKIDYKEDVPILHVPEDGLIFINEPLSTPYLNTNQDYWCSGTGAVQENELKIVLWPKKYYQYAILGYNQRVSDNKVVKSFVRAKLIEKGLLE